ncbi:hypothetical protein H4Q26_012408 [Puccinia striiformis f. sp. tritici PST-130]|nr:hypothetical protein H4Q26_012408 [Puccinia striiformis f. sp. tritici PST-130]
MYVVLNGSIPHQQPSPSTSPSLTTPRTWSKCRLVNQLIVCNQSVTSRVIYTLPQDDPTLSIDVSDPPTLGYLMCLHTSCRM